MTNSGLRGDFSNPNGHVYVTSMRINFHLFPFVYLGCHGARRQESRYHHFGLQPRPPGSEQEAGWQIFLRGLEHRRRHPVQYCPPQSHV